MFRWIVCGVMLGVPAMVNAGSWTGFKDVSFVGVRGDATTGVYFKLSEMSNPELCDLSDHYFIRSTNPMMSEMYSLVLSAKKSGSKITAKLEGCDNGRPMVTQVIDQ